MLQFNELRIDSNKHLIIDVEVTTDTTLDPHQIIAINHVYVGFGTNVASECTDFMTGITVTSPEVVETSTYDGTTYIRHVRFDIDLTRNPIQLIKEHAEKTLIYVQVTTAVPNSIILSSTSCSDFSVLEGFVYDKCLVVNKVLDYISQFDNMCANTDNFANYIIQSDGLELAIQTGNFLVANAYWNKFFGNQENNNSLISNCGCRCH